MKKIGIIALINVLCNVYIVAQTTINYQKDSTTVLQNPERGFCEYSITYASNYSYLTTAFLDNIRTIKNQTILFRYFNLDAFLNAPISSTFLANMQSDFDTLRKAGFTVIVRFAYSNIYIATPPYLDAPIKPALLAHIAQLKPYLFANADVILTLQNGFWGTWGENYYTDYYGYDGNNSTTATNWADRKEILDSLLTCMPPNKKVSVRTPVKKAYYFNQTIPQDSLTASTINNGTNMARVGGHNDCFLADYNDYTFDDTTIEKPFWSAESRYTIMGGETCNDNPIFTNCTNAKKELQRFHWTYCNDLYEPNVIDRWKNNNCFAEIENKLGYRINLKQATFSNSSAVGDVFDYTIQLYNSGYAAPVNPKLVTIFANHINANDSFEIRIPADVRTWYGQSNVQLSGSIYLPNNIQIGDYKLYLRIADTNAKIANNKMYSIQLANNNMWLPAIGVNNLAHTLSVISTPLGISNIVSQINCNAIENVLYWQVLNPKFITEFLIETSDDNITYQYYKTIANNGNQTNWQLAVPKSNVGLFYKITSRNAAGQATENNTVRCTGINDWNIINNNSSQQIMIESINITPTNLQIIASDGAVVFTQKYNQKLLHINTSNYTKGIYIIKLQNRFNVMINKIVVQ